MPYERIGGRQKTFSERWLERFGIIDHSPESITKNAASIVSLFRREAALLFDRPTGFRRREIVMPEGRLLLAASDHMATMEKMTVNFYEPTGEISDNQKSATKEYRVTIRTNKPDAKFPNYKLAEVQAPGLQTMYDKDLRILDHVEAEKLERIDLLLKDLRCVILQAVQYAQRNPDTR